MQATAAKTQQLCYAAEYRPQGRLSAGWDPSKTVYVSFANSDIRRQWIALAPDLREPVKAVTIRAIIRSGVVQTIEEYSSRG